MGIRITHTVVLHDPYDDPQGLQLRESSPEPTAEMLSATRIGADEELNDYEGLSEEQINEIFADKEAKARATILEMVGDLPDADVAPPENVLFVCKLNPVTADEDLEIIFSRFGKVVSCEVIRDKKTGDSLQYAFVEFDCPEACERAYFKMDNVLIDDRRIHVDFSQSVSQYKWKGKGRLEIVENKEAENDINDLIKKERAEIKVSNDGKIKRDLNNLKAEKSEKGRYDNDRRERLEVDKNKRHRSNSREKRNRLRSRERERRRERSKSRDRKRESSRDRKRNRSSSRDRKRERSIERRRNRSKERNRSRERYDRDRSRDRNRRSRSRDRDQRKNSDKHKKSKHRRRSPSD